MLLGISGHWVISYSLLHTKTLVFSAVDIPMKLGTRDAAKAD